MKLTWFKRAGGIYLPIHAMGMLVTLAAIAFVVTVCMNTFRNMTSMNDDLLKAFAYVSCTSFWWKWIAEKTS